MMNQGQAGVSSLDNYGLTFFRRRMMSRFNNQGFPTSFQGGADLSHESRYVSGMVYDIERKNKVNMTRKIIDIERPVAAGAHFNTFRQAGTYSLIPKGFYYLGVSVDADNVSTRSNQFCYC
jgi:hypothetical protein